MKKWVVALLLTVLIVASGYVVYQKSDVMTSSPWQRNVPLSSISKAITDKQNNLYVIHNSKKSIVKLDPQGTVLYTIKTNDTLSDIHSFNGLAVDNEGNLYTSKMTLDPYGLVVKSERIVRFSPTGQEEDSFFPLSYSNPAEAKRFRYGSLKSLDVQNDVLTFFVENGDKVTMYRMPTGGELGATPQPAGSWQLPAGKFVAGVVGNNANLVYITARSGEIYRINDGGQAEQIYPLTGVDRTRRNFPEQLQLDKSGRLVYIDYNAQAVSRLDPAQPYVIEALLTVEKAKQQGIDLSFEDMTGISVGADNGLITMHEKQIIRQNPDGTIQPPIVEGSYASSQIFYKWLIWAIALVGVLLLGIAIRLFYLHIMLRRISLMLKQMMVFIPIIVGSMILLSYFIYTDFTEKMENETLSELSLLARNGRNLIDGDKLERMNSPLDYKTADYKVFRQKMDSIFEDTGDNDDGGFYKALYKYENGTIYRMIEDADDVNMFNPFPKTPKNTRVVELGTVETDQWQDDTGFWMYAIGPIFNSSGKVVGVFETSKNMEGILQHRQKILRNIIQTIAVITLVLLAIVLLTSYYILSSIRKLRNSALAISKGNWETVVDIRTRDEVADLGDSFNVMAAHIRSYIAKVTRVSEAYYRFVPQQFLRFLDKDSILDVELGDQVEQEMGILIVNIRAFYLLSKRLTPEENFNFVNSYLNRFGPFIRNNDGMINKYQGAGFMALFPKRSDEALLAGIGIIKELEIYNAHRASCNYAPIDMGIGLHKGPLRLGIIGEEQRLEGNVISDDVYLASVLEKITEPLGASILVSSYIIDSLQAKSSFQYRNLGLIRIEGKDEPLQLYDVYQGEPDTLRALKEKTKAKFEQAILLYQVGRFYDAREAFLQVIKANRQDKAAKLYFYLCDEYFQNGTTEDWNGTLSVS
ncbi:HAMP domain-containing protein [Paenibacillus sp. WQ 127069]|jgi:adenylate cyclase|uniref:HAMP domain-containing protein n=1 Tax=Paenibacillus baimaensis TaxID=2982185 RepID=A0ABT2UAL9_9BACL|nr:adenylate/guanylate cyclase domain-containing protein [Paenibacillus sp. WQ 127069]MCU6791686.1 HAMP domain-containing protein [Paenibacillus sp. WQ 127069]